MLGHAAARNPAPALRNWSVARQVRSGPIALGNALGQGLVDSMQGVDWSRAPDESAAESARLERSGNRYASWPDQTDAESARLGRSGNPYAYWPDQTDAETARLGRTGDPYAYWPDQTGAESARLKRYEGAAVASARRAAAARDRQWIAQDDAIMARRAGPVGPTIERARALGIYSGDAATLVQGRSPGAYMSATTGDGLSAAERYLRNSGAYAGNAGTVEAQVGPTVGPAVALTFGGLAALVVRGGFAAAGAYDLGYGGAAIADGNYLDGAGRVGAGLLSLAGAATPIRNAGTGLGSAASQFALDAATIERIRGIPMGERPNPATYMPADVIEAQLSRFDSGASRFTTQTNLDKYGPAQRDGTAFVITRAEADRLVATTAGNARAMEEALGLPKGLLESNQLVRVDVPQPRDLNLRIPSGNEAGANPLWIPGGRLPNGSLEAVIDLGGVPASRYSTTPLRF